MLLLITLYISIETGDLATETTAATPEGGATQQAEGPVTQQAEGATTQQAEEGSDGEYCLVQLI